MPPLFTFELKDVYILLYSPFTASSAIALVFTISFIAFFTTFFLIPFSTTFFIATIVFFITVCICLVGLSW